MAKARCYYENPQRFDLFWGLRRVFECQYGKEAIVKYEAEKGNHISKEKAAELAQDFFRDLIDRYIPGYDFNKYPLPVVDSTRDGNIGGHSFYSEKITIRADLYIYLDKLKRNRETSPEEIRLAEMAAAHTIAHEASHQDMMYPMRTLLVDKYRSYVDECFADLEAVKKMGLTPEEGAEVMKYKVDHFYDKASVQKENERKKEGVPNRSSSHPASWFRIDFIKRGDFSRQALSSIAKHAGKTDRKADEVMEEISAFEKETGHSVFTVQNSNVAANSYAATENIKQKEELPEPTIHQDPYQMMKSALDKNVPIKEAVLTFAKAGNLLSTKGDIRKAEALNAFLSKIGITFDHNGDICIKVNGGEKTLLSNEYEGKDTLRVSLRACMEEVKMTPEGRDADVDHNSQKSSKDFQINLGDDR